MKKKFSYKDILYKSKRLTALALIVVFGTGLMVTAGIAAFYGIQAIARSAAIIAVLVR